MLHEESAYGVATCVVGAAIATCARIRALHIHIHTHNRTNQPLASLIHTI